MPGQQGVGGETVSHAEQANGHASADPHDPERDKELASRLSELNARLEEIVRTLEKGEAPLDQSITLYQEGDRLRRHCEARLKDAQARIEQIAFGSDGKPAGLKPFDAG